MRETGAMCTQPSTMSNAIISPFASVSLVALSVSVIMNIVYDSHPMIAWCERRSFPNRYLTKRITPEREHPPAHTHPHTHTHTPSSPPLPTSLPPSSPSVFHRPNQKNMIVPSQRTVASITRQDKTRQDKTQRLNQQDNCSTQNTTVCFNTCRIQTKI